MQHITKRNRQQANSREKSDPPNEHPGSAYSRIFGQFPEEDPTEQTRTDEQDPFDYRDGDGAKIKRHDHKVVLAHIRWGRTVRLLQHRRHDKEHQGAYASNPILIWEL